MGNPCFSFLKCFLCCQDELDDTFHIDCSDTRRTSRIKQGVSQSHDDYVRISSSPSYSYQVIRESDFRTSQSSSPSPRTPTPSTTSANRSLTSSSKLSQSSLISASSNSPRIPTSSTTSVNQSSPKLPQSSLISTSSNSPRTPTPPTTSANQSSKTLPRLPQSSLIKTSSNSPRTPTPTTTSANPSLTNSSRVPQSSLIIPSSNSLKPATSSLFSYKEPEFSTSSQSSSGSNPSSQKLPPTLKPFLSRTFSPRETTNQPGKANYELEDNDALPLYLTPEDVKDLIKKGIVPEILKKTLSPSRYKDYFSALLYAEDYYHEKWSDYQLENVSLELHEAAIYKKSDHRKKHITENEEKDDKIFVAFKIDAIPERRPFLLSRDLVYARPSGSKVEPFQGIIYRVVKSNLVLVDFDDEFHFQHHSTKRYDISFSFNRVCLKRAHQALNSISDSLLENFLFPNSQTRKTITTTSPSLYLSTKIDHETSSAIRRISAVQSSPPYLICGPRCASESKSAAHLRKPSRTGEIILESVIQIYRKSPNCRILICSPSNSACDVLMRALKRSIPESAMFRANAAFREREDVPEDILSSCLIKEECFACPPIHKLREFKVIFSTFVSCFRLHNVGVPVGHFSHIFMVDASFAIEPEAMVVLANFSGENTAVVVAGEAGSSPNWVRSEIGRRNGLKVSYFERLRKFRPYLGLSPEFITQLDMKGDALYM